MSASRLRDPRYRKYRAVKLLRRLYERLDGCPPTGPYTSSVIRRIHTIQGIKEGRWFNP